MVALTAAAAIVGCRPRGQSTLPRGPQQMVVTAHPVATRAGLSVLRQGGNAIDAAVAAAFALAVVEPYGSGLGGGGFLLHFDKARGLVRTLDFRERAPLLATRDMYQGEGKAELSLTGHQAVAVPGFVAGLAEARQRYGRLAWAKLLEPARRAAAEGFPANAMLVHMLRRERKRLAKFPATIRALYPGGRAPKRGARYRQADLAGTLTRLQRGGAKDFYTGETAKRLLAEMERGQGLITRRDLMRYQPRWGWPVQGTYRGYRVYSMGNPSSGGAHLIQMLHILEGFPLRRYRVDSAQRLHLIAETMRLAFADRARYQGDASRVKVPTRGLLSPRYAAALRRRISTTRAQPSGQVKPGPAWDFDGKHTSHVAVVDRFGSAVSMTLTINTRFGSGVVAPGTGVVLNNEMDDFAANPGKPNYYGLIQSEANAIAPEKTPLSSMTPTLLFQGGRLRGVLGSPGGPTIITTVLQMALSLIDHGRTATAAVRAPRIHHQWVPRRLLVERPGPSNEALARLRRMGHNIVVYDQGTWGNAMAIWIDAHGRLTGAADPRGDGVAAGF